MRIVGYRSGVVLAVLLLIQLSTPTLAETTNADDSAGSESAEVQILRAQVEAMERHHDDLLSTVHWTLGVILSGVVLLLGYNWYQNRLVYAQEKEALVKELRTTLGQELDEAREELARRHKEEFSQRLARMEFDLLELERYKWNQKGVLKNALRCDVRLLNTAVQSGTDEYIAGALNALKEDMSALSEQPANNVLGFEAADIQSALARVPAQHQATVERIQQLLRDTLN
ncbi:hypothetical protein SAMN04488052_10698 [Aquisalimonas asiatica]|uniref:Uncharacterized protein n=2 Tax=Aquisalimonas asiatica TaxID=406100 RepID=A0A1H8UCM4_9GAMM|nr:hypothetical protein SAMN04488052_10698 [Aquisalimonas asiatica]